MTFVRCVKEALEYQATWVAFVLHVWMSLRASSTMRRLFTDP